MELMSISDAASRLGVSVEAVERMIADDRLVAIRFATGVRVVLDEADRSTADDRART
jgi:excisionase family DNA binding protein